MVLRLLLWVGAVSGCCGFSDFGIWIGKGVVGISGVLIDLLDTLLGPFEVSLDFFGGFRSIGEIGTGAFEAALGERLQFGEFALFGVEFAGSGGNQ